MKQDAATLYSVSKTLWDLAFSQQYRWMISGFHCGINEIFALLGCYAV